VPFIRLFLIGIPIFCLSVMWWVIIGIAALVMGKKGERHMI